MYDDDDGLEDHITRTEHLLVGNDQFWRAAQPRAIRPLIFIPPESEELQLKYSEFVHGLPVHAAVSALPESSDPLYSDDVLITSVLMGRAVSMAWVDGHWELVAGRRVRKACRRIGILPTIRICKRNVIAFIVHDRWLDRAPKRERVSAAAALLPIQLQAEIGRYVAPGERERRSAAKKLAGSLRLKAREVLDAAGFAPSPQESASVHSKRIIFPGHQ
jgi:hypothetical protein